ncbi:3-deoxy-D-manno-octulosonic acid transferase [Pararhodobacter sp.]|uniref:3-deoxy-D-manno-octulosonic acid transferase n=1 Tax=Pararhodobacter sp. TaxID=2127056 RepID=UPI002AFEC2B1|nr:3-deoxy-D-manno-octulosonic acid transferase [Pararhodobacter sp.]
MGVPFFLRFYTGLVAAAAPIWWLALEIRKRKGLENPDRIAEKFGNAQLARPSGRLIWFHAASVGESLALLTLFRRLETRQPALTILLTTSTYASEKALDNNTLPANVIHQYAPIETPTAVRRFLNHWQPDALFIAEIDLWPTMMLRTAERSIPIYLINAILTEKSVERRLRAAKSYAYLIKLITRILVQDETSVARFVRLGAAPEQLEVMGVLKSASDPLPDQRVEREKLDQLLCSRPRWLAAATHEDEDRLIIAAHALACQSLPDLLLILAPRQLTQADKTEAEALKSFRHVARRSRKEPMTEDTQVYIADTMGEMGLWYRMSKIAFLGHSLALDQRPMLGKNPFEALQLSCVVIHGPSVSHFAQSYARLQDIGAARQIGSPTELAQAVVALQDPALRQPYLAAAQSLVAANMEPLENALRAIDAFVNAAKDDAHELANSPM